MSDPLEFARRLRKDCTAGEYILWKRLRNKRLNGRRWRRQQPIDKYIVDFFCPEFKLVVEIDGPLHENQKERDKIRQTYLESCGLTVIRFPADDITFNTDSVLTKINELTK